MRRSGPAATAALREERLRTAHHAGADHCWPESPDARKALQSSHIDPGVSKRGSGGPVPPLSPRLPKERWRGRLRRERLGTGPTWKPQRQNHKSHRHRRTRSRRQRCPISRARHRANRANRRSRASRSNGSRPLGRLSLFTGRTRSLDRPWSAPRQPIPRNRWPTVAAGSFPAASRATAAARHGELKLERARRSPASAASARS
jgi:hypothetical protein